MAIIASSAADPLIVFTVFWVVSIVLATLFSTRKTGFKNVGFKETVWLLLLSLLLSLFLVFAFYFIVMMLSNYF